MKLIKADHDRRLELPGVPVPVRRPVDIDQSRTGFANLRSLRIYQFDAQSVINGHAEEDEVFVIAVSGSLEFSVREANTGGESRTFTMSAASESGHDPCVAYLAPHSAYQLTPRTTAIVAYARATPLSSRPSTVFPSNISKNAAGITVLFEEANYAQRLRLRLLQVDSRKNDTAFTPLEKSESGYEALVHIQAVPGEGVATVTTGTESVPLHSWDTIAIAPEDYPTLSIVKGSSALVLVVLAT